MAITKERTATIKLQGIEFDFGRPEEYPMSHCDRGAITLQWLENTFELQLDGGSTISDVTREELTMMATEFANDNSGWLVNSIDVDWSSSVLPEGI